MRRRDFIAESGLVAGAAVAALSRPGGPGWLGAKRSRLANVVLRGATVIDGTGRPRFAADVAVDGDRIAAVGRDLAAPGADQFDVRGLVLAPGFVDIHSHTDLGLLVNPNAESKIRQGVTTEIAGQDGSSIGPWTDRQFEGTRDKYRAQYGVELDFRDLAGFFRRLTRDAGSVNVASMVGAGTVRANVIGSDDRPATEAELGRMVALVREALGAGACGVSSGLEYIPGAFASLDELVALARPLHGTGLPYASHMRNEDDQLFAAIEEALNVGRMANVPVQISHLKAQGRRNWWKAKDALAMIEHARADGIDVTFDRYPYVAYSTGLNSLFPIWAREGGTDAFLGRLSDQATMAAIELEVRDKVAKLGSWDAVQITSTTADTVRWARGRKLGELAKERGVEPYELLLRVTREDRGRAGMVGFGMSEENTELILSHPLGMVCSDAGARATYGALSSGTPHPRAYGSFPRVLGHYSRDRGLFGLETAIRKFTAMPADKLRLSGRGRIVEGGFADLVAFDPDTVADNATFENPHQYPTGIPHVMVNGEWVILDGEHTGATPGRVLRPE
ncbi:MAG: D-aminoacylase [Gemmatimonadetes bacterium]|nr:D-aminoacylase [Gemmatimonadota bacterium]